ncbi:hypothetical protein ACIRD6_13275 [Streptomyces sp. NPDC102473]|uniref:hypothetical protein n=1 Tax=Streptomyces sp. NPDC102473 TaxID=3366180 RepID=UPI00380C9515
MPEHVLVTEAGARLAVISCALRNTGGGWQLIADTAHAPSGVSGVIQHPDHLEITHDVGAIRVSSLQVTPDEYYAARAVRCGASVGLALTRIYLYKGTSTTPVDPATLVASSGNLWVTGLLELA